MSTDRIYKSEYCEESRMVTTREAVSLAPNLSRDYIARLVRDGVVAGVRTDSGYWMVDVGSFQNFLQTKSLEETVRAERTRFERLQEQELQLLEAPLPPSQEANTLTQSLSVTVAGCIVGICLFFSGVTVPPQNDSVVRVAEVLTAVQVAAVAMVSRTPVEGVSQEFQLSGGYVEVLQLSESGQAAVLFQSVMEEESTDVMIGLSADEVMIAVASVPVQNASSRFTVVGQDPFVRLLRP